MYVICDIIICVVDKYQNLYIMQYQKNKISKTRLQYDCYTRSIRFRLILRKFIL